MESGFAIRTTGLTKRYGEFVAVDGLDLELRAGEVFGLLGPNGAGKTTTILMLLGLTEPSAGAAEVAGFDPTRQPLQVKRVVGYLPDNVGFYVSLTGRENLRFTAHLNGMTGKRARERVDELLDQVGLSGAADDRVDTYSRGMRQRLGIADALVKEPKILILDEPTVAIDPEGVAEILRLIRALARERDVTILLSSHLLHQVRSICDRVGIFVRGRMVASGRVGELARAATTQDAVFEVGIEGVGDPLASLRALPGVTSVARDETIPELAVVTATAELPGHLGRALTAEGGSLVHLRRLDHELDELYRSYFKEDDGGN